MTIPSEARDTFHLVRQELGQSLVAAYLHGSVVTGRLRPDSDVDVFAVTEQSLSGPLRRRLVDALMHISGKPGNSARRPIELTIVRLSDLAPSIYPGRCELLYGEWLRADFESGAVPEPVADPEITLILAQIRQSSKALFGPEAHDVLPDIPESVIRQAIVDALPALLSSLEGDERNVLLTLARMWHTLETGEFIPKDIAETWAATRLPSSPAAILMEASDAYTGERQDHWSHREQDVALTIDVLRQRIESTSNH